MAAIALLVAPAVILAQKTSYDFEKTANFAAFKTYAHKEGTKVGQPLIDDRIVAAIETQLAAKGLTKADVESRTCSSSTTWPSTRRRTSRPTAPATAAATAPYGWGWGGGWAGGTTTTQVRDILIGTLVIDMADAKKGQLVWRGMGVKEVNTQAKPEKRDKSINNAVKKIFKNYPPKVKK